MEDEEVDILECCSDKNEKCNEDDNTDDVWSSSFTGTVSEHDDESEETTACNDQEADSIMCTDDAPSLPFLIRKKKLTDHWKRFIQPITWRCKWLELKIRELQNQARKYDKEVQESCQTKQLELENLKSEELGVKALPTLPCHTQKTRLKKRIKRKRVEEFSDVTSYALNHNLFSYHENRKSFGVVALNDNFRNLDKKNKNSTEESVFCEETAPPLEFREGDAYLEHILLKIDALKVEARNLKNRVDKVVNENPSLFTSVSILDMLGSEQQKPHLVIEYEDDKPDMSEEKPVKSASVSEEKPVKSASVSSHHDTQPEDDDETTDILLSEMMASIQREGKKAIVPKKTEQASAGEGPSRPVRIRKPRNLDIEVKEETKPKRRRVSKEKPTSNVTIPSSRPKRSNRKRKRGKPRSGSAGSRRRS